MTERTVALSEHSKFYHRVRSDDSDGYCGGLKDVETMTELEAIQAGYEPCQSCVWPEQEIDETPADLPEELYTTATPRRCQNYHTDRTCGSLNRDDPDVTEPSESAVRYHGLTPCPFCAVPDYEGPSTTLATDGGISGTGSEQSSFTTPAERAEEVIARLARQYDAEHVTLTVSGGTDSVVAADLFCRIGPKYGLAPDSITHINTGIRVPQSHLTARLLAEVHNLEWIEEGYRREQDSIAHRVLKHGWPAAYAGSPATGGHGTEWANRKDGPMNEVYVSLDGLMVWVSGARKLESKKRQGNVPDSGIEKDRARRVWCSPICGWTDADKRRYVRRRGLPVSEAYLVLGFSGECVACAFDETSLLTRIDLLCPELAAAIEQLTVWIYLRAKRGEAEIDPKELCWGHAPGDDEAESGEQTTLDAADETAQAMVGCDEDSCATRDPVTWVRGLPGWQIVDRADVKQFWNGDLAGVAARFDHLNESAPIEDPSLVARADGGERRCSLSTGTPQSERGAE